jgi:hypothetical protein
VDSNSFSYGNGNANHYIGTGVFIGRGIIPVVKRIEFISERTSYITLRGRSCDIVPNVCAPKVMVQRIAFLRNYSMYSNSF